MMMVVMMMIWAMMVVVVGWWSVGCDGVGERRKSVILGAIVHQVTLTFDLA